MTDSQPAEVKAVFGPAELTTQLSPEELAALEPIKRFVHIFLLEQVPELECDGRRKCSERHHAKGLLSDPKALRNDATTEVMAYLATALVTYANHRNVSPAALQSFLQNLVRGYVNLRRMQKDPQGHA